MATDRKIEKRHTPETELFDWRTYMYVSVPEASEKMLASGKLVEDMLDQLSRIPQFQAMLKGFPDQAQKNYDEHVAILKKFIDDPSSVSPLMIEMLVGDSATPDEVQHWIDSGKIKQMYAPHFRPTRIHVSDDGATSYDPNRNIIIINIDQIRATQLKSQSGEYYDTPLAHALVEEIVHKSTDTNISRMAKIGGEFKRVFDTLRTRPDRGTLSYQDVGVAYRQIEMFYNFSGHTIENIDTIFAAASSGDMSALKTETDIALAGYFRGKFLYETEDNVIVSDILTQYYDTKRRGHYYSVKRADTLRELSDPTLAFPEIVKSQGALLPTRESVDRLSQACEITKAQLRSGELNLEALLPGTLGGQRRSVDSITSREWDAMVRRLETGMGEDVKCHDVVAQVLRADPAVRKVELAK